MAQNTQKITLRHLHKLKLIRRQQEKEQAKKYELLAVMYGNGREDDSEIEKRSLQILRDKVALEIERAKIAQEDKERIAAMALKALKKTQ